MSNKEFVRDRMVQFQQTIAELSKKVTDQEDSFVARQREIFNDLFEVLDTFDNLEKTIQAKEDSFDKTAKRLTISIRKINRKLLRTLNDNSIIPIQFPDNKARMDLCKIIGTEESKEFANEHIISIEKTGYMDITNNIVIRKAEVISVYNEVALQASLSSP